MLLNIFPCTGQTPQQRILQPEMSVVPRLRIPGWVPGVSEHVRVRMCVFPPLHLENETYTGYSSSDPYGGGVLICTPVLVLVIGTSRLKQVCE